MPKTIFRKATYNDKENVIRFLENNIKNKKEFNFEIFDNNWSDSSGYGWLIQDEEKIRGFIGEFRSIRKLSFGLTKCINMTSWSIDKDYRNVGLKLFDKYINYKNCIFTNFSASHGVEKILPRYNFYKISNYDFVMPLFVGFIRYLFKKKSKISLITKKNQIIEKDINKFIDDHKKYNCQLFKIENNNKKSLFIVNKIKVIKNKFNCIQVLYSNDYNFLLDNIFYLNLWFFINYNSFFISFSSNNIKNYKIKNFYFKRTSKKYLLNTNKVNLSNNDLEKIDLLYSESIIHNYYN